jgi:hypothetical protein
MLAFLPMLALLTDKAAGSATSSDGWEMASPASVGLDPNLLQSLIQKIWVQVQNIGNTIGSKHR